MYEIERRPKTRFDVKHIWRTMPGKEFTDEVIAKAECDRLNNEHEDNPIEYRVIQS